MKISSTVGCAALVLLLAAPVFAGPREDLVAGYAQAASSPGFSAAQGQALHEQNHTGGKPGTPSCTTCHGPNPQSAGSTPTGKNVAPAAVSVTPTRYTDSAKVEKWFKRNCLEVLGRECTAQEKGDWLTYMINQ